MKTQLLAQFLQQQFGSEGPSGSQSVKAGTGTQPTSAQQDPHRKRTPSLVDAGDDHSSGDEEGA